jgi:hypothetical protein
MQPSPKQDDGGYPVGRVGWNTSSPDALHVALGQGIADRVDSIECECAHNTPFRLHEATERIVVQTAKGTTS